MRRWQAEANCGRRGYLNASRVGNHRHARAGRGDQALGACRAVATGSRAHFSRVMRSLREAADRKTPVSDDRREFRVQLNAAGRQLFDELFPRIAMPQQGALVCTLMFKGDCFRPSPARQSPSGPMRRCRSEDRPPVPAGRGRLETANGRASSASSRRGRRA